LKVAERAYFHLCRGVGRLLRASRYSSVRVVVHDGQPHVHKQRAFYAPLLVRLGDALVRVLNTGVRVLPQREWEERERSLYATLGRAAIRIEERTVILPVLDGRTLADLLDDSDVTNALRLQAIEYAASALAAFHKLGFTHGDAMAENVMIDIAAGEARWFDFETVHVDSRPVSWRRADDVRALLYTCVLRTPADERHAVVDRIMDAYGDEEVIRMLEAQFTSAWQRGLTYHLGQAPLSFEVFRDIARMLRDRVRGSQ
jgi:hypothetical protein